MIHMIFLVFKCAESIYLSKQCCFLHFSHLDSSDPSEQSSFPLHLSVSGIQRLFLQKNSPGLHFTTKKKKHLQQWDIHMEQLRVPVRRDNKAFIIQSLCGDTHMNVSASTVYILFIYSCIHLHFNPPQFSSSVLSPQSSNPSHSQNFGLQRPFLHFIWDASHSEQRHKEKPSSC